MNPLHPLTIPTYRQLFAAMVLTIFAQGAWALYLAMQTLDLGATPAALSGVVVWSGIGLLAGSLPAGVIADRFPNKSVIVSVLTLNLTIATATSTAAILDIVTFWMLAVSAFIIGTSTAFFFPAYTALVPVLVDGDDLMAVNGLEGAARPLVGQAIAPAAVGAVIGASMPAAGGYLIAGALGLALIAALRLPAPCSAETDAEAPATSALRDLLDGFGYVARTRWVRSSVLLAAAMGLAVTGPLEVLLPAVIRSTHDNGPAVYGVVLGVLGVGGLVGSLVAGSWPTPLTLPARNGRRMGTRLPSTGHPRTHQQSVDHQRRTGGLRCVDRSRDGHLGHGPAGTRTAGDARPSRQPRLLHLHRLHATVHRTHRTPQPTHRRCQLVHRRRTRAARHDDPPCSPGATPNAADDARRSR
ncbi:MFS transporter [Corynebacterium resistens]|mgnify:CR=1 FL=1